MEQRSRLGVGVDGDSGLLDRLPHEGGDRSDPALDVSVVGCAPGTRAGKVDRPVGKSQRTRIMADRGRLRRMAVAQPAVREVAVAKLPHRPGQGIFQKPSIATGSRVGADLGEGRGRPQAVRSEQFAQPPFHVRVAAFRLGLCRGELRRKVARGLVIVRAPVTAVGHRHERPGAGNPCHAALCKPQIRLNPGIHRVHHVGAGREAVPRPQLFGDGRPAHEGPAARRSRPADQRGPDTTRRSDRCGRRRRLRRRGQAASLGDGRSAGVMVTVLPRPAPGYFLTPPASAVRREPGPTAARAAFRSSRDRTVPAAPSASSICSGVLMPQIAV